MTLALGASVLLLGQFLFHAWEKLLLNDPTGLTWRHYGILLVPIAGLVLTIVICYRGVFLSKLPSVLAILVLTGLLLATALLNRGLSFPPA